jgi:general stress protein YciG
MSIMHQNENASADPFSNDDNEPETIRNPAPVKKARGFALLSRDRVKEIASRGGKRVHELGKGHRFTHEEAVAAGSKGGKAYHEVRGRGKKVA